MKLWCYPPGIIFLRTLYIYCREFSSKFNQIFSLLGLTLIIGSIVFFNDDYIPPFPNVYTLIPTCGTILIIIFGQKNTIVGFILNRCLLRWIGLISYSAYLWHQPLLAFIRLQSNQTLQISTIIIIISVIFPLSLLSYFFIEQPFRNKQNFSQKQIFSYAGLATVITLIIALFVINNANCRSSLPNKVDDTYLLDLKIHGNRAYVGRAYMEFAKKKFFSNRTSTLNRRIALVGDSFAEDFYNMIIEGKHLINYEFCVYFIVYHCQIYLSNEDRGKFLKPGQRQPCTNAHNIKYALPIIHQANIIILASRWQEWSAQNLPTTIKLLNLTNSQQLFILGTKNFGIVNPKLYVDKSNKYRIKQYQYPLIEAATINNLLEKTLNSTIFINVQKMICTGLNQTCPVFTPNGKLISYDGFHLTKYGAIYIGDILFNNKPLNKLK